MADLNYTSAIVILDRVIDFKEAVERVVRLPSQLHVRLVNQADRMFRCLVQMLTAMTGKSRRYVIKPLQSSGHFM
jgi:hypothetical protein